MTGMRLTFGIHLDGERFAPARNCLGEASVGPLGLLGFLETHLGLLRDWPSRAERIVQYRQCLQLADRPKAFFHRSFETDQLGSAQTLLDWRDTWYLHGWDGTAPDGAPLRIADLALAETFARSRLAPSIGERLVRVRAALAVRRPPLERIVLVEPLQALPVRWREVLAMVPVDAVAPRRPSGQGFLAELQQALTRIADSAAAAGEACKLAWRDDGSVCVVQAETAGLAAAWAATQLGDGASGLLVAPAQGARLDATLAGAGLPRQGFTQASAFRPTLQVLPLALEIIWDPINFYGLVQFLTHPVCPIPGFARRALAGKIADRPGIGGRAWERVLETIAEHYGDKAAEVRQLIRDWLEHARYSPQEKAPIQAVIGRVERVGRYFQDRLMVADPARRLANNAGFAQCRACAQSLRGLAGQGVESIGQRQLQILVQQATAQGSDNPMLAAQVGASGAITHPGAAVASAEQVLWWNLAMPTLPAPYAWTAAELKALHEMGVLLPPTEFRLAQAVQEWLRPVLAASKRLVLVLPAQGQEVHPLWQMMQAVVDKPRVVALESLLSASSPATRPVEHCALPAKARWWQLPADVQIPMRGKESFSSLELLLFNPSLWLFKYPARLRPSNLISMSADFRMLGNLAHELVGRFYGEAGALTMPADRYEAWFAGAFAEVVREEGATLLMPGRGTDLENFRYKVSVALSSLRGQLHAAGVTRVTSEMELTGSFAGGALAGFADLVVETARGRTAIIDMKYGGIKKYPDLLKTNRHLQLAIYAELARQMQGTWPGVAYFILERARMFAPDSAFFQDAEVVASLAGENTAQLWQRFLASWKWRCGQIQAGRIEVALNDIEPTEESAAPADAIDPCVLDETYNDYVSLCGWTGP